MSHEGVRPGGGRNPLPFSEGGGFTGLTGSHFMKRWVMKPEIYPLYATMVIATGVCMYAVSREFTTNPKYKIMKGKRVNEAIHETDRDGQVFTGNRLIPHAKTAFKMFPFDFVPIKARARFEGGNCE